MITVRTRRAFLKSAAGGILAAGARAQTRPPNVILIYADDMGYGDLSCYGSSIATPNLDRMAAEGTRFTHFCSASSVCSPSRAALLTGRYPTRVGVPRVLDSSERGGLPETETTLAQMLKGVGYSTMAIGKWHLGSRPEYLPTNRGFDEFFGIPYSHDMSPRVLMRNTEVIEQNVRTNTLMQRFTQTAVEYIHASARTPFFLYVPSPCPHIPLAPAPEFIGKSGRGLYGDTIQELDWSAGQILQAVKDAGLDDNTLVIFSSDNGPWYQGSKGRLRGRKGDTFEGGFRVPFIARFPGRVPGGNVSSALANTMDMMPTVAHLTGAALPGKPLDGVNIWPVLTGEQPDVPREAFLYFNDVYLQAARLGPWKLHMSRFNIPMFLPLPARGRRNLPLPRPELYNVLEDSEEAYDRAERNRNVVGDIQASIERQIQTFPDDVRYAYADTLKAQVEDTPVQAPPVEKEP